MRAELDRHSDQGWVQPSSWSYHRGVESRHDRVVDFAAAFHISLAGLDHGDHLVGVGRPLHVGESFGPGCRAHQPHEGKYSGYGQILNAHSVSYTALTTTTKPFEPGCVAVSSVNLRSWDPCCSPCTSQRRRCRWQEPPWSRGRRRRRWWRRTRQRRSSRQPGKHVPCSRHCRWGHRSILGGVWREGEDLKRTQLSQVTVVCPEPKT